MKSVTSRLTAGCEWALRQPLLWGAMTCLAFYALVVDRLDPKGPAYLYFREGDWVWKAAVATLFATGAIQLIMRLLGLVIETGAMGDHAMLPTGDALQLGADADGLLAELDKSPRGLQNGYLLRRLRIALEWIKLRDSADGLDGVLSRIAADDRHRMHDRDGASRAVAVAAILVGAIGSLVGISKALAMTSLAPDATTPPQVLASLATALEPSILALGLVLVLAIGKFIVGNYELNLLAEVDRSVDRELLGRFRRYGFDGDPHSASIAKMSEKVLQTVSAAAAQHDAALGKALAQTSRRWEEMATSASNMLQRTLGGAITSGLKEHSQSLGDSVDKFATELNGVLIRHAEILNSGVEHHTLGLADALEHHAAVMAASEHGLAEENRRHLSEVEASVGEAMLVAASRQEKLIHQSERILDELQVSLVEAAGTAVAQQEQLVKHTEVLLKVIEATGQIRRLEDALNSNLSALASSQSFEEAANTLSAAVQLLSARLGRPAVLRSDLDLSGDHTTSHAA